MFRKISRRVKKVWIVLFVFVSLLTPFSAHAKQVISRAID
jgi:hypothetical protein